MFFFFTSFPSLLFPDFYFIFHYFLFLPSLFTPYLACENSRLTSGGFRSPDLAGARREAAILPGYPIPSFSFFSFTPIPFPFISFFLFPPFLFFFLFFFSSPLLSSFLSLHLISFTSILFLFSHSFIHSLPFCNVLHTAQLITAHI